MRSQSKEFIDKNQSQSKFEARSQEMLIETHEFEYFML